MEVIEMILSNKLKKTVLILLFIASILLISRQSLFAQRVNYKPFQISTYNNAVTAYNKGDYVTALQEFNYVLGSIIMQYYGQMTPPNVQSHLTEIIQAISYCKSELSFALDTKTRMQKYGSNFTVRYKVYSGGKMDSPSASRTVQENVTLYQPYTHKPTISGRLY
jgi:hypothetical protein